MPAQIKGIEQYFDLNIIPDSSPVIVHVDQYDHGEDRLHIQLYDGAKTYHPTDEPTAIIQGIKPDNKGFSYDASINRNSGEVTADLTEQMTAVAGKVRCQIVVNGLMGRAGTFDFILDVQKSALPEETDISETELPVFIALAQEQADEAAASAEQAAESEENAAESAASAALDADRAETGREVAENAEAWAVGEKNGEPVPSTDPTYHNNAKYYAEHAESDADRAEASAEEAGDSEAWAVGTKDGEPVPSTHPAYHNNSKYWSEHSGGHMLSGLDDVDIDTPASGDSLTYNGDKWINKHAEITSSAPYTFRQGLGTMADMEIVGGTVAWNQLVQNGDFSNGTTGWQPTGGSLTASNNICSYTITTIGSHWYDNRLLTNAGEIRSGNKRLIMFSIKTPHTGNIYICKGQAYFRTKNNPADTWNHYFYIENNNDTTDTLRGIAIDMSGYSVGDVVQIKDFMVIDLTAMFGSTIADYIYSLEQATAGAGIAWFRKYFPNDYYSYDAGSLQSVEGLQSRDVSGFNQWDEEWEVGSFSGGQLINSDSRIRNKNAIPVLPNTTYYFCCPKNAYVMDVDAKTGWTQYHSRQISANSTFVTSAWAKFIWLSPIDAYGTTYNHDICINISDPAKDGTYEPYHGHSYPLDSSLTLRGIPKLDSNNKLYYDGDIYSADGAVTRKYGIVDLGTLSWNKWGSRFEAILSIYSKPVPQTDVADIICSAYVAYSYAQIYDGTVDKKIGIHHTGQYVEVADSSYASASDFKTAMSGVYLVYELATPTTESAKPFQNPQRAFSDGTEEFATTGIVPVGNNTTYQLSKALIQAEDYTDGAVRVVQRNVDGKAGKDMISDAWVSGQAYSVGNYCIYGDTIYRCIQTVTQGTAILPTNTSYWTPVKIAAEIKSAKSDSNFALLGIAALEESLTPSYHYGTDALNFLFQSYDSSVFPAITDSDCVIVYGNIVLIHLSVGGDLATHYMIGKIKDSMRPPFRGSTVYTAEVDTTMVITPLSGTAFDYSVVHVRIASNGDMIMSPFSPLKNNATGTFTLMYIKS